MRRTATDAIAGILEDYDAKVARLTARIAELEKALKPFASLADGYTCFEGDDYVAIATAEGITIRVGELRFARTTLKATEGK